MRLSVYATSRPVDGGPPAGDVKRPVRQRDPAVILRLVEHEGQAALKRPAGSEGEWIVHAVRSEADAHPVLHLQVATAEGSRALGGGVSAATRAVHGAASGVVTPI